MLQGDYVDVNRQDDSGRQIGQNFWDIGFRSQIGF
jgi:hypothetical protein